MLGAAPLGGPGEIPGIERQPPGEVDRDLDVVQRNVVVGVDDNFDIAPSNISLSALEQHLSKVQGRETKLKEAIDGLYQIYDYVIYHTK